MMTTHLMEPWIKERQYKAASAQSRGYFPSGENRVSPISGTTPEITPLAREALSQGRSPSEVWDEVSRTRVRIHGMRSMRDQGMGHNMDEDFLRNFKRQSRYDTTQGKHEKSIVRMLMDSKVKDQEGHLRRLKNEKN